MAGGRAKAGWPAETIRYVGHGRATFVDPTSIIEGPATVEVGPDGATRATLAPERPIDWVTPTTPAELLGYR